MKNSILALLLGYALQSNTEDRGYKYVLDISEFMGKMFQAGRLVWQITYQLTRILIEHFTF